MEQNELQKIAAFLNQYKDLYGKHLFVNSDRLQEQIEKMPELQLTMIQSNKTAKTTGSTKLREERKDSPLWKFREEIKDCTNCALGFTRTKFVFGSGNENAELMFVGEAPGAEEDRTGIPFVGRAGKLLDKLLSNVRLKREDVFIANILKCRPPNNRDPQPEEVKECFPYLYKQIEMIQPRVLIALGRVAAQNLLETNSSLKQMRGRLWKYRGKDMVVTYHPAAILRNPGLLQAAKEDFEYIKEISTLEK